MAGIMAGFTEFYSTYGIFTGYNSPCVDLVIDIFYL